MVAEEAAEQEAALTSGVVQEIDLYNPETLAKESRPIARVRPPPLFHSSLRDIVGSPASDGLSAAREHTVQADLMNRLQTMTSHDVKGGMVYCSRS